MDSSRLHTKIAKEALERAPSPYKKIYEKYSGKNYELQNSRASTSRASFRNQNIKEEVEEVYMIDDDFTIYYLKIRTRMFFKKNEREKNVFLLTLLPKS